MGAARLVIILILNSIIRSKSLVVSVLKQILFIVLPYILKWLKKKIKPIIVLVTLFSCQTPRIGGVVSRKFTDQSSTAIMRTTCNDSYKEVVGVFACEEKKPSITKVSIKILPVQGRVIYSNGLEKKIEDFNWQESGFWIWKKKKITDTWVDLDLGDLKTTFGDAPIAFDVAGITDVGVVVNRGLLYYRRCDDVTIPCSYLVVKYNCNSEIKNTWENQIGYCNRMSGGSQSFEVPLKGPDYSIVKGSYIHMVDGTNKFDYHHKVTDKDFGNGFVKIEYPVIENGPTLLGFMADFYENGMRVQKQTYVLIVGYSPEWTGIDSPHFYETINTTTENTFLGEVEKEEKNFIFYRPILSDLFEVVSPKKREVTYKSKIEWGDITERTCAYAWQRQSGDIKQTCVEVTNGNR